MQCRDLSKQMLSRAVVGGDAAEVQRLIERGADVNETSGCLTPLQSAVWYSHLDIARVLIQAGANVNALSSVGRLTAIHLAMERNSTAMVRLLINAGANVNAMDGRGDTPMMVAARFNLVDLLRILMPVARRECYHVSRSTLRIAMNNSSWGCARELVEWVTAHEFRLVATDGTTILHEAVMSGNVNMVRSILNRSTALIDAQRLGRTALVLVILHNLSPLIMSALLNAGADLSIRDGQLNKSPLQIARDLRRRHHLPMLERHELRLKCRLLQKARDKPRQPVQRSAAERGAAAIQAVVHREVGYDSWITLQSLLYPPNR